MPSSTVSEAWSEEPMGRELFRAMLDDLMTGLISALPLAENDA
jgi:hypothetical protein